MIPTLEHPKMNGLVLVGTGWVLFDFFFSPSSKKSVGMELDILCSAAGDGVQLM